MSASSPAVLSRDTDFENAAVWARSAAATPNPMLSPLDFVTRRRGPLAGDGVADVTANAATAATAAAITESNYRVVATSRHRRRRHRERRHVDAILTGQRHRCRVRPRNVSMPTSPISVSIPSTLSLPANPSSLLFRLLPTIRCPTASLRPDPRRTPTAWLSAPEVREQRGEPGDLSAVCGRGARSRRRERSPHRQSRCRRSAGRVADAECGSPMPGHGQPPLAITLGMMTPCSTMWQLSIHTLAARRSRTPTSAAPRV